MFAGAITCLLVSLIAAFCGYCGIPDPATTVAARYVFLLSISCFAICALLAIAEPGQRFAGRRIQAFARRRTRRASDRVADEPATIAASANLTEGSIAAGMRECTTPADAGAATPDGRRSARPVSRDSKRRFATPGCADGVGSIDSPQPRSSKRKPIPAAGIVVRVAFRHTRRGEPR
jgi:uncharacterized membrane protein YtjA (UPF0391 family)